MQCVKKSIIKLSVLCQNVTGQVIQEGAGRHNVKKVLFSVIFHFFPE